MISYPNVCGKDATFAEITANLPYPDDMVTKAVPLPGSEKNGYSPIFRNNASKDELFNCLHHNATTIYELFEHVVSTFGANEFLGRRTVKDGVLGDYKFQTYAEVAKIRDNVGSGFMKICKDAGIKTEGLIIALYSGNTYEWMLTDLACHAYGFVNTTLYDSLGPESSIHILRLTESPIMVLSKQNIATILKLLESSTMPDLKILVSMDDLDPSDYEAVAKTHIELYSFKEVMDIGKNSPAKHVPPKPSDLMTISFTSGSTGMPKGVELTHEAFACAIVFCYCLVKRPVIPTSFSFLPLAHVLERFKVAFEIAAGARIALPSDPGNVKSFLPDIKALGISTHLCAVPRVYSKIEQGFKIRLETMEGLKGTFVRSVVSFKEFWDFKCGANGQGLVNSVIDKVVLSKIRDQLGFHFMEFFISGGAPINESTVKFIRSAFGAGFYAGYGLTESFAAICISRKFEKNLKGVGPIGVTAEMRLRDVPELGYTWKENRSGEILVRGPQIFKRYFKDEEKTKEVFDEDGFFKTGDVGRLDSDGQLEVIDRVKNFFKLAQGEYIAVERIENTYLSSCGFMEQIFIHGDSLKEYLVAIVGVLPESVKAAVSDVEEYKDLSVEDISKLLSEKDKGLSKVLLSKANESIAGTGLFGFEKVKKAYFLENPLTIENDCITPTMKLKRQIAKKVHKDALDDLYSEK